MRKIITLLLGLIVTMGMTQNAPINFEPGGNGADWTWTVFENATNPALEIIANPDPSGANTSATVAKFTALQAGQPWAGTESAHGDTDLGPFVLDETNSQIKIMVWKPVISNVGIKLVSSNGWAQVEILVPNTVVNEWEELTFDFSSYLNPPAEEGQLDQIVVFPDFDTEGREQDNVVYFDNISFNPVDDEPTDGPEVAAPAPPALAPEDVVSVFSDAFSDVVGTNFNPGWGQTTQVSFVDIEGNETMKYASFNYQGIEFASALNVTGMETLHLDMWTANATSVNIFLISTGPVETAFALPITPDEWVSYDIPLSAFTGVNLEDVIQIKFDGGDGSPTLFLDNLYFYTGEVEEGTDATLSDLMVDGTTVEGFSPSVPDYTVVLPEGTTDVPVVTVTTNDPEASAAITPATELPGTTSILVTSANTEVEKTYTVEFIAGAVPAEPEVAAPTPPALEPENVLSVFSDAFANVEGTNFNPDWGQTTVGSIIEIDGNETLKFENFNYQGTEFDGSLDVSDMEYLHLDMWTADATSVNVFTISPGPVETGIALAITPGEWVSYDIPLSDFTDVDMTDLIQFKFDGGDGSPTIYLDNLYFYKNPTSVSVIEKNILNIYPNPVNAGSDVRLGAEVDLIEVYDLTGKRVLFSRNASAFATEGMRKGVYMVRILDFDGTVQVRKLVVN